MTTTIYMSTEDVAAQVGSSRQCPPPIRTSDRSSTMALPAFENYSDEKLVDPLNAILAEQERRANLARISERMAADKRAYIEGGGDPAVLAAALERLPAEAIAPLG